MSCPLCQSSDPSVVAEIRGNSLNRLARRLVGNEPGLFAEASSTLQLLKCAWCDLEWFAPSVEAPPKFYEVLQRLDWYYQDRKPEYEFARMFVSPRDALLEVGCGKGSFALVARPAKYVGLEYNEEALSKARRVGLTVIDAPLCQYASEHESGFDVVAAFQVLEHVKEPRPFLAAATRALRRGGRLVISVPNNHSYLALAQNSSLNMPPHHQTRWTKLTLERLAQVTGMGLVAVEEETLADEHRVAFLSVLVDSAICSALRWDRPIVDDSIAAAIRRRLATWTARFLSGGLEGSVMRPKGHSITAVYEKRS